MRSLKEILLDIKTTIIVSIIATIVIIGLLVYGQFFYVQNAQDVVLYQLQKNPRSFPMYVFASKDDFSEHQVDILKESADVWVKATKGYAKIEIIPNWEPPFEFTEAGYKNYEKLTLFKKSTNNKEVASIFLHNSIKSDGITLNNTILVFDDNNNITDSKLKLIVAHELGHMLRLEHLDSNKGFHGLMELTANSINMSKYDILEFNYVYSTNIKF